jgi:prevent-host-death family protein
MAIVNIYEAKTKLSKLVDQAASGEDVIIARNGKPLVRLTTLKRENRPFVFGLLKGEGWIADDFNNTLPDDIRASFEGRE